MARHYELLKLRAIRGKATEKKALLDEYKTLETMGWHFTILATGNESSTYDGLYPETVSVARDNHFKAIKDLEAQIRELCY